MVMTPYKNWRHCRVLKTFWNLHSPLSSWIRLLTASVIINQLTN